MTNLGGHDIETVIDALRVRDDGDQPTCFIAYTIKGMGLPFAGHKDNHAGLMTKEQMEVFRASMGIRPGHEWDPFEGLDVPEAELRAVPRRVPLRRPLADAAHDGATDRRCRRRLPVAELAAAGCPRRRASATSSPRSPRAGD